MPLEFNLDEEFPYLSKAPITEAVVQINARATAEWTRQTISSALKSEFGETIPLQPIETSQAVFIGSPVGGLEKKSFESSWLGFRIDSAEPPEVISFTRDSFSFSRLQPYERWDRFLERAMALFQTYVRIANPGDAQRIGLRFINRIEMSAGLRLDEYLEDPPRDPSGLDLPINGFLHQSSFETPGYPYSISVVSTLQQTAAPLKPPAILLDLDVFTVKAIRLDLEEIKGHLQHMRWLKNKMFFAIITRKLEQSLV